MSGQARTRSASGLVVRPKDIRYAHNLCDFVSLREAFSTPADTHRASKPLKRRVHHIILVSSWFFDEGPDSRRIDRGRFRLD